MNKEKIETFVKSVRWKFAKTMPFMPHWYIRLPVMETPEHIEMFKELTKAIFEQGTDKQVGKRIYRYLEIGEYKYWSMDPSIELTDLINRAYICKWVDHHEKCDVLPELSNKLPKIAGLDWT